MTSSLFAIIGDIGGAELLLIFVLVLVLFGGKRLPEFARGLGRSIREFKKATSGVEEEIRRVMEDPPPRRKQTSSLAAPAQAALPPASDAPTGVLTDEHAYDYDHAHYDQGPYDSSADSGADPYHPGPDTPATAESETTLPPEEGANESVTPTDAPPAAPPEPAPPPANGDDPASPPVPKDPGSPQG